MRHLLRCGSRWYNPTKQGCTVATAYSYPGRGCRLPNSDGLFLTRTRSDFAFLFCFVFVFKHALLALGPLVWFFCSDRSEGMVTRLFWSWPVRRFLKSTYAYHRPTSKNKMIKMIKIKTKQELCHATCTGSFSPTRAHVSGKVNMTVNQGLLVW